MQRTYPLPQATVPQVAPQPSPEEIALSSTGLGSTVDPMEISSAELKASIDANTVALRELITLYKFKEGL